MKVRGIYTQSEPPKIPYLTLTSLRHAVGSHPIYVTFSKVDRERERDLQMGILSRWYDTPWVRCTSPVYLQTVDCRDESWGPLQIVVGGPYIHLLGSLLKSEIWNPVGINVVYLVSRLKQLGIGLTLCPRFICNNNKLRWFKVKPNKISLSIGLSWILKNFWWIYNLENILINFKFIGIQITFSVNWRVVNLLKNLLTRYTKKQLSNRLVFFGVCSF